jgi:hypothetical protein
MILTKITSDFTVSIPDVYREQFTPGQEVAITADNQGRLVVTPIDQIRSILSETFGMWSDRTDIASDSITYMDEVRHGHRLNESGIKWDEDH